MRQIVRKLLKLGLVATLAGCFFGKSKTVDSQTIQKAKPMKPFYSIKINSLEGKEINLENYKGKKILVVNTASECGFTPQYEDLQKLHETYGEKVVIIGTPCNQFGGQEPGDASSIKNFCQKNYSVSFLMTEKLDVKGSNQHALYEWLTKKSVNCVLDSEVGWNFNKFLINEEGNLLAYFPSTTDPMSSDITSLIEK